MSKRTQLLEQIYFDLMEQMLCLQSIQVAVQDFNADNPEPMPITADDCPWLLELQPRRESLERMLAKFETYLSRQYDANGNRL
jgi:hypothetical protein